MRRHRLALPVVALSAALALAGCGSSGSSSASSSASPSAGSSATSGAPTAPYHGLPKITAGAKYGEKPTVPVVDTKPSDKIEKKVLVQGDGKVVAKGDLLVANYLGQTWSAGLQGKPNVFDNSYDRKMPAGFGIGVGKVVTGWDDVLVGQKLGSRILMSLPPSAGYGAAGQPNAGIPANATLVFVVDLVDTIPNGASSGTAVAAPAGFPQVDSQPGKEPTFTSVAGVTAPAAVKSAILVDGDGAPIDTSKQLAVQYTATDLSSGKQVQKSWGTAPLGIPDATKVPGLAEALKGKNIGTRVELLLPATQSSAGGAVLIFDIIGQY